MREDMDRMFESFWRPSAAMPAMAEGTSPAIDIFEKDNNLVVKAEVPGLCVGCHKMDRPAIVQKHLGYPVAGSQCTSCHDAHGSDRQGLLYNRVHSPVAKGMCSQCHQPAGSKDALATKQEGAALCTLCHAPKLKEIMGRNEVHRPVLEGQCLACHNPHASSSAGLMKGSMTSVCGRCHADSIKRQTLSPTKHAPVGDGQCTACHDPHSADAPLMLVKPDTTELCGTCHDWLKHTSHPMGEKNVDPRNRNLRVQCLSCHRAHGTEFRHMMPYATSNELCTKCHEKFRR
jgi:predicted CXXCH cytochrome family protein